MPCGKIILDIFGEEYWICGMRKGHDGAHEGSDQPSNLELKKYLATKKQSTRKMSNKPEERMLRLTEKESEVVMNALSLYIQRKEVPERIVPELVALKERLFYPNLEPAPRPAEEIRDEYSHEFVQMGLIRAKAILEWAFPWLEKELK